MQRAKTEIKIFIKCIPKQARRIKGKKKNTDFKNDNLEENFSELKEDKNLLFIAQEEQPNANVR